MSRLPSLESLLIAILAACQPAPPARDSLPARDSARETARDVAPGDSTAPARAAMVADQLRARDIRDSAVLSAIGRVPRHEFVPAEWRHLAYTDGPLPIGFDQTISQPYIVAYMTQAAEVAPTDRVLEIGTGSGYQAAILAELAREVWSVEIVPELAARATAQLAALGYRNVHVRAGDGYLGWKEHAPYDAIVVTAGGPDVPRSLLQQLAVGGRLVMPVGSTPRSQRLMRVVRTGQETYDREALEDVCFVPLIGAEGWPAREGWM